MYSIICIEVALIVMFVVPNLFGVSMFVVSSGSMEPRFNTGSVVYVKKAEASDIAVGDTITFYMKDSDIVATHEVYEADVDNLVFRTQGINNKDEADNIIHDANSVPYEKIVGKVVFCVPYAGVIYSAITNGPVLGIIIVATISIILISFLLKRKEQNGLNDR